MDLRGIAGAAACLGLIAALWSAAVHADVDISEYESKSTLKDRKSREAYLREIAAEIAEEARREAALAELAQREAEARRLAEEARPWPERLTEQRCTLCHAATNYTNNGHTLAGWWVVALRMKQLNRAPVLWDELQVIVLHLAKNYPARGMDGALEWSLVLAGFVSPLMLAALWRWIRKPTRV